MKRSALLALALGLGIFLLARRRRDLPPDVEEAWSMLNTEGYTIRVETTGVPVQTYADTVIVDPDELSKLLADTDPGDRFAVLVWLLAHELAHDPATTDSIEEELDADRAAGAALAQVGADPGVVARSIRPLLGAAWTHTHGDPEARAAAIMEGMQSW